MVCHIMLRIDFIIDSFTPADWEHVRAIYLEGLATGQATFEVDAPSWEQWDAGHLPVCGRTARTHRAPSRSVARHDHHRATQSGRRPGLTRRWSQQRWSNT